MNRISNSYTSPTLPPLPKEEEEEEGGGNSLHIGNGSKGTNRVHLSGNSGGQAGSNNNRQVDDDDMEHNGPSVRVGSQGSQDGGARSVGDADGSQATETPSFLPASSMTIDDKLESMMSETSGTGSLSDIGSDLNLDDFLSPTDGSTTSFDNPLFNDPDSTTTDNPGDVFNNPLFDDTGATSGVISDDTDADTSSDTSTSDDTTAFDNPLFNDSDPSATDSPGDAFNNPLFDDTDATSGVISGDDTSADASAAVSGDAATEVGGETNVDSVADNAFDQVFNALELSESQSDAGFDGDLVDQFVDEAVSMAGITDVDTALEVREKVWGQLDDLGLDTPPVKPNTDTFVQNFSGDMASSSPLSTDGTTAVSDTSSDTSITSDGSSSSGGDSDSGSSLGLGMGGMDGSRIGNDEDGLTGGFGVETPQSSVSYEQTAGPASFEIDGAAGVSVTNITDGENLDLGANLGMGVATSASLEDDSGNFVSVGASLNASAGVKAASTVNEENNIRSTTVGTGAGSSSSASLAFGNEDRGSVEIGAASLMEATVESGMRTSGSGMPIGVHGKIGAEIGMEGEVKNEHMGDNGESSVGISGGPALGASVQGEFGVNDDNEFVLGAGLDLGIAGMSLGSKWDLDAYGEDANNIQSDWDSGNVGGAIAGTGDMLLDSAENVPIVGDIVNDGRDSVGGVGDSFSAFGDGDAREGFAELGDAALDGIQATSRTLGPAGWALAEGIEWMQDGGGNDIRDGLGLNGYADTDHDLDNAIGENNDHSVRYRINDGKTDWSDAEINREFSGPDAFQRIWDHSDNDRDAVGWINGDNLNGNRSLTTGVQDLVGWAMENDPVAQQEVSTFLASDGAKDTLNGYDNGALSGTTPDVGVDSDLWMHANTDTLVGLDGTRSGTTGVMDSLVKRSAYYDENHPGDENNEVKQYFAQPGNTTDFLNRFTNEQLSGMDPDISIPPEIMGMMSTDELQNLKGTRSNTSLVMDEIARRDPAAAQANLDFVSSDAGKDMLNNTSNEGLANGAINSDTWMNADTDTLLGLDGTRSGTTGVMESVVKRSEYYDENYPGDENNQVKQFFAEPGATSDFLNRFTNEQLNGEDPSVSIPPAIMDMMSLDELRSLKGTRSDTIAVQNAIALKEVGSL